MGVLLKVARIGFLAWRCTHRVHPSHSTLVKKKMAALSYFYASFHTCARGYFWPQNKSRLSNSMYTVKSCFNYMLSGGQQFLRSMRKFQRNTCICTAIDRDRDQKKKWLYKHFALSLCLWWVQKAMFQVTKRCTEQENLKAMPGSV